MFQTASRNHIDGSVQYRFQPIGDARETKQTQRLAIGPVDDHIEIAPRAGLVAGDRAEQSQVLNPQTGKLGSMAANDFDGGGSAHGTNDIRLGLLGHRGKKVSLRAWSNH